MRTKILLGLSVAVMSVTGPLHSVLARADGPESAYDNGGGGTDASLDPGEQRVTADEENKARLKELYDAYHNGYIARAKEDAETYASLREQLKRPPQQAASQATPLPEGMPPGRDPQAQQAYSQAQYSPYAATEPGYQPAPAYAAVPAYATVPPDYPQQAYADPYYAPPPPPPPPVQYVPVYGQYGPAAYVPQPPVQAVAQPVVTIAAPVPYPVYRAAYWAPRYPRPYAVRYGYYRGWR